MGRDRSVSHEQCGPTRFSDDQASLGLSRDECTYVCHPGRDTRSVFFSLDAANRLAVVLARRLFHLPYYDAIMRCERSGDTVHYRSHRIHRGVGEADFAGRYRPVGPVSPAPPGSLVRWFTERYCLYTVFRGRVYRAGIHHRQWALQPGQLDINCNTVARAHNIRLPDTAPALHYSDRQEVLVWPLRRVS